MTQHLPASLRPRRSVAAVVLAAALAVPSAAGAQQTAEDLFRRAQAREAALAQTTPVPVEDLRSVAWAYEVIVLTYPKTGYADNALWQGAALLEKAYGQSGETKDRLKALQLLTWLGREYPTSPLARQVAARATAIETSPRPSAPPPAAPTPATPPAAPGQSSGRAALQSITHSPLPRGDRITIELSQEVPYAHGRVGNPDRIYFDFANASAAQAVVERLKALGSPLVKGVRIGRPTDGVTRVVLDLEGRPKFSAFPLYNPFRLVVDVESTAAAPLPVAPPPAAQPPAAEGSSGTSTPITTPTPAPPPLPPPMPTRESGTAHPAPSAPTAPAVLGRGEYSIARQLGLGVSRIVIDAGHGGHDPGAQANGLTEADLVLDIALRLERLLQQHPGFDVVLTRRTDAFIPLEGRTAIANKENADLFLSIHANSTRQTSVRGVETYFLNFATNPDAEAVAARENATSGQSMGTLPAILNAIALNNKLDESRELASILQTSLVRRLLAQNKSIRDLGVKQAPFVVLIGAQMPSVLAEVSFLSNRNEAALLKQSSYRQHIAQALCDAIVKYQASLKKITTQRR